VSQADETSTMADLPPATIDRDSIPDLVYQTIRRDIARGHYKPGVLRIRPLAERFCVSATPIREALRRLESEGLVTLRNRRIMVRAMSAEELDEIFAVRTVLERYAIAEAVRRGAGPELLETLERLVGEMDETAEGDPDRWREANQEFHMAIYGLTGNPRLMSIIDSLWVAVEPYLRLYVHAAPQLSSAQDEHRAMLEALRDRDADRATEVLRMHLVNTKDIVRRGFAGDAQAQ
jgi:DNA-binding GntR family transcriptional regulator